MAQQLARSWLTTPQISLCTSNQYIEALSCMILPFGSLQLEGGPKGSPKRLGLRQVLRWQVRIDRSWQLPPTTMSAADAEHARLFAASKV